MSILSKVTELVNSANIPVQTGVFEEPAPDLYAVLIPLMDNFEFFSDDRPGADVEEIRVEIFSKGNYRTVKKALESAFLEEGLYITERRYIGFETDTGYHHYSIDVEGFSPYSPESSPE